MIAELVTALVMLDGPGRQVIWVNPAEIVSFRAPTNSQHFPSGVECVLQTADGKIIPVVNDCNEVRRKIGDRS